MLCFLKEWFNILGNTLYLRSCQELDENIDITLMSVQSICSWSQKPVVFTVAQRLETAHLALSKGHMLTLLPQDRAMLVVSPSLYAMLR